MPGYGFEWLGLPGLQVCESTAAMFAILRNEPGSLPPFFEDDLHFCREAYNRHSLKLGRGIFNGEKGLIGISLVLYEEEYLEGAARLRDFLQRILQARPAK